MCYRCITGAIWSHLKVQNNNYSSNSCTLKMEEQTQSANFVTLYKSKRRHISYYKTRILIYTTVPSFDLVLQNKHLFITILQILKYTLQFTESLDSLEADTSVFVCLRNSCNHVTGRRTVTCVRLALGVAIQTNWRELYRRNPAIINLKTFFQHLTHPRWLGLRDSFSLAVIKQVILQTENFKMLKQKNVNANEMVRYQPVIHDTVQRFRIISCMILIYSS